MGKNHLFEAKQYMKCASKSLAHCVIELRQVKDADFERTIKEINENIGDLQVSIEMLEMYGA